MSLHLFTKDSRKLNTDDLLYDYFFLFVPMCGYLYDFLDLKFNIK